MHFWKCVAPTLELAMVTSIFSDKEHQPGTNEVFDALGSKQPLWEKLTRFISDNYPIVGEWNFGGKNYGWNIWYRKSGKTLVTLYPQREAFIVQIVLGRDQVEQALNLKLGKNVGTVLKDTPQLHDGRWLFIQVKAEQDVRAIQQLLQVKRRPKPQRPV
jgi:hypothetical protein